MSRDKLIDDFKGGDTVLTVAPVELVVPLGSIGVIDYYNDGYYLVSFGPIQVWVRTDQISHLDEISN